MSNSWRDSIAKYQTTSKIILHILASANNPDNAHSMENHQAKVYSTQVVDKMLIAYK